MSRRHDRSSIRRWSCVLLAALGLALALIPVFAERLTVERAFEYLNTFMQEEPYCVPADVHQRMDDLFSECHYWTARCVLHAEYPVCEER